MITVSLQNFVQDRTPRKAIHAKIYVIRDRKIIFYVGMSNSDVVERAKAHFGLGDLFPKHGCEMEQLAIDNVPESKNWKVDFYTIADCEKKLKMSFIDARQAEEAMIFHLGPYLNVVGNVNRKSIPGKYTAKMQARNEQMAIDVVRKVAGE